MCVITFDRVTKTYSTSTRPALNDVSVQIDKGEFQCGGCRPWQL